MSHIRVSISSLGRFSFKNYESLVLAFLPDSDNEDPAYSWVRHNYHDRGAGTIVFLRTSYCVSLGKLLSGTPVYLSGVCMLVMTLPIVVCALYQNE
jgi:hypothetical protein